MAEDWLKKMPIYSLQKTAAPLFCWVLDLYVSYVSFLYEDELREPRDV